LGFRKGVAAQRTPTLIPELKNITTLTAGTNHILALNNKGKVFAWGAGEQNQLARRVVSRTAIGALIPREFGLQRKLITKIGCGDYHSFAIDNIGKVYSWGLNTFGQTGVPKDADDENNTIKTPTIVESLGDFDIKQIVGGGHHTLSVTKSGQVLIWGRIDNAQGGMEVSKFDRDDLFFDENQKPRFLVRPAVLPDIEGEFVAAATDNCLVVTKGGEAYSWGFSANYQTGQGTTDDIKVATLLDNTAVRGKKLVWCGAGGQFSVLAGEAADKPLTNGI
jgi:regulator of chromosome condensation